MSNASGRRANNVIGIIGSGVIGEALLTTLITSGVSRSEIYIADKRADRVVELVTTYGVRASDVAEIVKTCTVILLVIKPQDMEVLLNEYGKEITSNALVISFVAGKTTHFVESHLDGEIAVVRVMPNTPILLGKGMSAISSGKFASDEDMQFVRNFLESSGKAIFIEESLQDAVTSLSGSGPAYFFSFVEAMIGAGEELGLTPNDAKTLVTQTIIGAAAMLEKSGKSAATLRENVTSPKGTTAAALKVFEENNLTKIVLAAMTAARDRSAELA